MDVASLRHASGRGRNSRVERAIESANPAILLIDHSTCRRPDAASVLSVVDPSMSLGAPLARCSRAIAIAACSSLCNVSGPDGQPHLPGH